MNFVIQRSLFILVVSSLSILTLYSALLIYVTNLMLVVILVTMLAVAVIAIVGVITGVEGEMTVSVATVSAVGTGIMVGESTPLALGLALVTLLAVLGSALLAATTKEKFSFKKALSLLLVSQILVVVSAFFIDTNYVVVALTLTTLITMNVGFGVWDYIAQKEGRSSIFAKSPKKAKELVSESAKI